ncbi:hypothetical protein SDC9_161582 [bioreactor metagenome]|uniref:Uncharacterized protein n=1 Tax=bioreactor metagenome TaxID=1076179 RepID=A0A645FKR9_9ZZZZ
MKKNASHGISAVTVKRQIPAISSKAFRKLLRADRFLRRNQSHSPTGSRKITPIPGKPDDHSQKNSQTPIGAAFDSDVPIG